MPTHQPPSAPRRLRRGYSLLELTLAIALAAGTLAPALALLRDGMAVSRKTDEQLLLTNYAVRVLEERLAVVAAGWQEGAVTGSFVAEGFASLRYVVTSSDDPANGGVVDELMHVSVTTYIDQNANATQDAGELSCSFRTKVANLGAYVEKAVN